MKIAICASLDFSHEMKGFVDRLEKLGHSVVLPKTSEMVIKGEISLERIKKMKEKGEIHKRMQEYDVLRYYFGKIRESDAILVLNLDKKGVKGYVGGNTFLEMGFAHVLGKKIFLLNQIPDMPYLDEMRAMQPIVLNGRLEGIDGWFRGSSCLACSSPVSACWSLAHGDTSSPPTLDAPRSRLPTPQGHTPSREGWRSVLTGSRSA